MSSLFRASVAALMFVPALLVHAGDDGNLRALIAKAIKARGGDKFATHKGVAMKGAGMFYGLGEGIPYTGEWHSQADQQSRFVLDIKVMDQNLSLTQIVDTDKGWVKFNDDVKPMPREEWAEEKEELHAKWVTALAPLSDKAYKLAALGEVKIGDRPAVGVRVSREGKRDVNLFIDAASFLVVKAEHLVKDVKGGADKELSQEVFYSEFKDFGGIKFATKISIKRDGKQYVEATMSDARVIESVDAALFAKP